MNLNILIRLIVNVIKIAFLTNDFDMFFKNKKNNIIEY